VPRESGEDQQIQGERKNKRHPAKIAIFEKKHHFLFTSFKVISLAEK